MAAVSEEPISPYRWVSLGAFTTGAATALTTIFIFGLLLPDISEELGLSPSQQGWLGSSVVLGNLVLSIPLNEWLSKYSPRRVVILCFLGITASIVLQGWSPTLALLIVGRVALGISMMATQAPRALLIQQWSSAGQIPLTQAVMFGSTTTVWGLALIATPQLLELVGSWRNVLYVMGCVGGASTVMWLMVGRERVTTAYAMSLESQVRSPIINVLKHKQMWLLGLAMGSATVPVISFEIFWPTFAEEELDVSLGIAGITAGIVMLVGGPAGIMVNVVPWLARRQPLLLGLSGVVIISTGAALLHLHWVPALLMVAVVRGMVHVYFPAVNIMVYQLPRASPREVAAGMAVASTAAWAGAAIGPLLVGFVQEATGDLRLALYTTVFVPALGIIAAFVLQVVRSRVSLPVASAR